jgi:hypothetical protein
MDFDASATYRTHYCGWGEFSTEGGQAFQDATGVDIKSTTQCRKRHAVSMEPYLNFINQTQNRY